MVGGYVLKDGRRLGCLGITFFTTALVNELYGKLLIIKVRDAAGNVVEREGRTTVDHAMNMPARLERHVALQPRQGAGRQRPNPAEPLTFTLSRADILQEQVHVFVKCFARCHWAIACDLHGRWNREVTDQLASQSEGVGPVR